MTQINFPTVYVSIINSIDFFKVEVNQFGFGSYPETHIQNSQQLTNADAYVELFQIILQDEVSTLYFKNNTSAVWQGNTYEATALQISGIGKSATEKTSRPQLTIFNPDNVFNALIDQGELDGAMFVRYRVLKDHLERDVPVFTRQMWRFSRVSSMKSNIVAFELRDMLDGQNFTVPARMYMPPEFPAVSL